MKHIILPFSALVAGALLLGACGDEVVRVAHEDVPGTLEDTNTPPDAQPDTPHEEDTFVPDDGPPTPVVRRLEFVEAFGDDQTPCQGTDRCAFFVSYSQERTLEVRYTEDGEPVQDQAVNFELVEDPDGVGHLNTLSAYTNGDGVGGVQVSAANPQIAQFAVKASVDHEGVPPLYFDILITPKGQVPLTVVGEYAGSNFEVTNYTVRLYRQDGSGSPGCDDLETLYEDTTANWQSPVTNFPQSVSKQEFAGLEEDGTQMYTILAYSQKPQGDTVLAWGCDDVEGEVKWGYSTTVEVTLEDRPPQYSGTYTVTSVFNLVSALPDEVEDIVNSVLNIFQSPVGGLLTLACNLGEDVSVLDDLCGFVFDDPSEPSLDNLTSTGNIIVDIVDALIKGAAEGSTFGDVLTGGGDVADILTAFQVNGTITIAEPPDETGFWEEGSIVETWDGVTVKWSLGENCNPLTNENCGKKNFSFYAIQDEPPVSSTFTAYVENTWDFYIDLHPVDIKYGALLNYIVEAVVLPLLAGDGSDGLPVIDSYDKLIASLLGGKECLMPGAEQTCCETFTDDVLSGGGSIGESLVMSACEAIIQVGSTYIEDQLVSLDADTGESFVIGTLGSCKFIDADKDRIVDGFGTKSSPCDWDVQVNVFGSASTIDAVFWASRVD
ncbi:MAG: hypothetical protein ACQEXJ_02175 [Myxococcota bacterium]